MMLSEGVKVHKTPLTKSLPKIAKGARGSPLKKKSDFDLSFPIIWLLNLQMMTSQQGYFIRLYMAKRIKISYLTN